MPLNKSNENSKGVVLVLVLVIFMALSGLTLMTIEVSSRGAVEASRMRGEYEAHFVAEEILYLVYQRLRDDKTPFSDSSKESWVGAWESDGASYVITPCNSKINLNELSKVSDPKKILTIMKRILPSGVDVNRLLGSLGNWVGKSVNSVLIKMDRFYYASQSPSYAPSNDELKTPEEVMLVSGWREFDPTWIGDTFTVWGDEKLNINFVSRETLLAYFPKLGQNVDKIIHWRDTRGFTDLSQVLSVAGIQADSNLYRDMLNYLTVRSSYFEVLVTSEVVGCKVVKRYILSRSENFQDQLPKLIFQNDVSVTFTDNR
ncbi:general secretion pathway protein GspK [Maridesulfovibrio ferrireducens]|uniref:general secretion pathway protein GspK n=1 Tax=Maridesulfovibrio ferrireducens TaxID=246191 RepID=UPI001A33B5CC|nr:type II secretion system protein GspK [Maridesulfovibrio ferrireducens]MBI9112662.1 general secretion pathway protein GspK [Maridesulfovibrio ferrireducens]